MSDHARRPGGPDGAPDWWQPGWAGGWPAFLRARTAPEERPERTAWPEAGLKVEELMGPRPDSVRSDAPLSEAARLMRSTGVDEVPVVGEDGRYRGTVSETDLVCSAVAEGRAPTTRLADCVKLHPVAVDCTDDVVVALRIMAQHRLERLPVVDEQGRLVGLVTRASLPPAGRPEQGEASPAGS